MPSLSCFSPGPNVTPAILRKNPAAEQILTYRAASALGLR